MTASVRVFFEQRPVGTIDVTKDGPGFSYDPAWLGLRGAFPISLTMPLDRSTLLPTSFCPGQQICCQKASNYELSGNFLDYRGLT